MKMELKQGNTYIFIETLVSYVKTPFKGKVEEVTETTYLIDNLDTNVTMRYDRKKFENDYKVLETVIDAEKELKEAIEKFKKQPIKYSSCPNGPGQCYCTGVCKIPISIKCPNTGFKCHCIGTCPYPNSLFGTLNRNS